MTETLVLTGVTSGFGRAALPRLAAGPHRLIAGARNTGALQAEFGDRVEVLPLDLESLTSVRNFCRRVEKAAGNDAIDALGLNAGISSLKLRMTDDGFERTFQTNYLSHWLIFQRLQPRLSPNARVVLTGSGTHDPREKTPTRPPIHLDAKRLAHPDTDPSRERFGPRAGSRAYTSSKAACVAMAQELAVRHPALRASAFDPGFLPDTRLLREAPRALAAIVKPIIKRTMAKDRTGTVETSADVWAELVLGETEPGKNGGYIAMRGGKGYPHDASELVRTPGVAAALWDDTGTLLSETA